MDLVGSDSFQRLIKIMIGQKCISREDLLEF